MAHAEVIQNGVVIVKPDPRLRRALEVARQFLGKLGRTLPGLRSLIRHELILHWLHRQLHDFAARPRWRGKAVYIALDAKLLGRTQDLVALVRDNARQFLPVGQLEAGIRNAFSLIAREKIRSEQQRKTRRRVQTYGEPWRQRAGKK